MLINLQRLDINSMNRTYLHTQHYLLSHPGTGQTYINRRRLILTRKRRLSIHARPTGPTEVMGIIPRCEAVFLPALVQCTGTKNGESGYRYCILVHFKGDL
jgi:hypothetical protein